MDETGVDRFIRETKKQSKRWAARGESAAKKAKIVPSVGKAIASDFWDARGTIFMDYIEE